MKRSLIIALLLLGGKAYSQLFTLSFTGAGACPVQGFPPSLPANVTTIDVSRTGLSCSATNDCFNSSGWNTGVAIDDGEYIELTVTVATGYQLTAASINFTMQKSSTGPANGKIRHDGGTGTFSSDYDFTPGTSSSTVNWDFTDFTSSSATVKFRIYGWGAGSSAGTMRIDELSLLASVTLVGNSGGGATPFTFDNTNTLVGLGKTPTQKFDVDGNIRTSGKLLIGAIPDAKVQTLTDYALAVNGRALFTKAEVKLFNTWPDYVFDDKYVLPSIPELEKYIEANKHLPGVVPAAEAEKNGIDIAVTQASLLQKIEELTLYIIEQHKKIEALQKQNEEQVLLRKRIDQLEKIIGRQPE